MQFKKILLTGGSGYIGTHTAVKLSESDFEVVLYDNLSNSNYSVLDPINKITGKKLKFIQGDVRDYKKLVGVLLDNKIDAVIHFAGLKAVDESVQNPLEYFDVNVSGTLNLIKAMKFTNTRTLVFSSSATVYGDTQIFPIDEKHPVSAVNPYGRTKLQIEEILKDISNSDESWHISCLRYFNPIGSHTSGDIGENPKGVSNNLMPHITDVARGALPYVEVHGGDYKTHDGTGIRDFIHVMDLADGHLAALDFLRKKSGFYIFNLGTGKGYSVLEVINEFEKATGIAIPYRIGPRRLGDVAIYYAKVDKAHKDLGWRAKYNLNDMCKSTWHFQKKHTNSN
jgi:UDP-glucose 4-epimerase